MSQARIIDGTALAEKVRAEAGVEVAKLKASHGITPGLAVVLVGDDPASQIYVRSKGEHSKAIGMHSVTHLLPADTSQATLLALVAELNADPAIHGILVQPCPRGWTRRRWSWPSIRTRTWTACMWSTQGASARACRPWSPAPRWAACSC
jgi:hypothetical protein